MSGQEPDAPSPRGNVTLAALVLAGMLVFCALAALGTWQVERRAWKHDLIARVTARVAAEPVAAPARSEWPEVSAEKDAYRAVFVTGTFRDDLETLVQAVTDLGAGFWVITPLERPDGTSVLINGGFVPTDRRDPATRTEGRIAGQTKVTGLLRLTEPGGAFLRTNDAATGRWYSRDVAAIAAARGLSDTAPYFIDAGATPRASGYPVGGLTIVAFSDNHLIYALTWYVLAAMVAGFTIYLLRDEARTRRLIRREASSEMAPPDGSGG